MDDLISVIDFASQLTLLSFLTLSWHLERQERKLLLEMLIDVLRHPPTSQR